MNDITTNNHVQIAGTDVTRVEYKGHQVVTYAMIDKVHQRPDGTAKDAFARNRTRFVEGEDFHNVSRKVWPTEIDWPFEKQAPSGRLITKRGYLKIAKTLGDDKAWEVFDEMIERYFAVEQQQNVTAADLLANPGQLLAIAQGYALQIEDMKREIVVMKSDVDTLDRISGSDDLLGVRITAKILDMPQNKFTDWIQRIGWAYRQTGTKSLLCYADKHKAGYCKNTLSTYPKSDGTEGTRDTLKFYVKGIIRLAKLLNITLTEGDIRALTTNNREAA